MRGELLTVEAKAELIWYNRNVTFINECVDNDGGGLVYSTTVHSIMLLNNLLYERIDELSNVIIVK